MSLVDKLNVDRGDFVRLSNGEGTLSIGGFVKDYSFKAITLSHEKADPHVTLPKGAKILFAGDRTYRLEHFDSYEVYPKKEPPPTGET